MNRRVLNVCALGGPAAVVVTLIGWLIAGMLPLPIGPSAPIAEVRNFYFEHATRTSAGFVIASIGIVCYTPLLAVITFHMLRGQRGNPVLGFTQLAAGTATLLVNIIPMLLWATAGFRTDRSDDSLLLIHDMGWMILLTAVMLFIIQNVAIGVAILHQEKEIFPRWLAFLNFWVAASFVPDVLAYFFKTGPFAWNGVFVFWLALNSYCIFLFAMTWACIRANRALVEERVPEVAAAV